MKRLVKKEEKCYFIVSEILRETFSLMRCVSRFCYLELIKGGFMFVFERTATATRKLLLTRRTYFWNEQIL